MPHATRNTGCEKTADYHTTNGTYRTIEQTTIDKQRAVAII